MKKEELQKIVESNDIVLVDFFATWCGPCRMLLPTIDKLAKDLEGTAKVVKIDVDENPSLAQEFNVRSIPTLVYFKNGEVEAVTLGFQSEQAILDKIASLK